MNAVDVIEAALVGGLTESHYATLASLGFGRERADAMLDTVRRIRGR